jgi:hypothetical protein
MFARLGLALAGLWCGLVFLTAEDPSTVPIEAFVPAAIVAGLGFALTWIFSALFH